MEGLIHLYCGDGKGKTIASFGLAARAAGNNMKVVVVQFLKGTKTGEVTLFSTLDNVTIFRNKKDRGFFKNMSDEEIEEVKCEHDENIRNAIDKIDNNECDMLILDELCAAYRYELVDRRIIDNLILHKKKELELVITGRNPDKLFIDNADYITEMKLIRHPFEKGIVSRKGIEY